MGLPGSGKTTLAELLVPRLQAVWFNADAVRQEISSDLGFEESDRLEHARRMGKMCEFASKYGTFAVADFVCPTEQAREIFNPDIIIWVDRIKEGRFEDTNKMFNHLKMQIWCYEKVHHKNGWKRHWNYYNQRCGTIKHQQRC